MYIASSSTTVKFHSFPDGDLIYNYQPGSKVDGSIRDISWCKDGSWLSLVPKSGLAEIISVRSHLKLIHTIVDVEEPSCTAFQNTTKKFIAYGTKNGQVLVYDIKSKKIKNRYPRATSLISHVEFTARDSHLVAGCLNGDVLLYSNLTHGLSATYKIPRSESVSALRTNQSKRNFIIGGSNEGMVVVWDTNVNKQKFLVESHKAPVTGVAFSPINSDLIISTGADRQFCCYDIVSNKCIASVAVNSSMTAVDFSYDGTHFVMASQEGNICLYDSRKIMEPVLIFEAHKSTIKNIAFQKQEMINNSSLLEDKAIFPRSPQEQEDNPTNESFGLFLQNHPEAGDVPDCDYVSLNHADSFMMAMGLGNGNSVESMKNENTPSIVPRNYGEGDSEWNACKTNSHNQLRPIETVIPEKLSVYERRSLPQKQSSTSTPKFAFIPECELHAAISPIVDQHLEREAESGDDVQVDKIRDITEEIVRKEVANKFNSFNQELSVDQVKSIIEDVVRKEMSNTLNSFSQDMRYQFNSSNAQMRRMYLDMQMSIVKGFLRMDNFMNTFRENLASTSPISETYLLEENMRLKRQITMLEEQLANRSEYQNGSS